MSDVPKNRELNAVMSLAAAQLRLLGDVFPERSASQADVSTPSAHNPQFSKSALHARLLVCVILVGLWTGIALLLSAAAKFLFMN